MTDVRIPTTTEVPAYLVEHEIKVYPDAGHAFLNDHDPEDLPRAIELLARITHSEYHEPSARDARRRIVAFFDTHLKGRPANPAI